MKIMEYRLGKLPKQEDVRNLKLAAILSVLPPVPAVYDVDSSMSQQIPLPMFGNDTWGDCVMAARAHNTLRFEDFEQKKVINITDTDVLTEYWKEGGATVKKPHPDNGLVILTSLKEWRKSGWLAAGNTYTISAFAEIETLLTNYIKAGIYLLNGCYAGLHLPLSAQSQVGKVWTVVTGATAAPGSWGGHCIYLVGYNTVGPVCVTWGKKQQMTWAFWNKYADECYAIVQNKELFVPNSPVDVAALSRYLAQL